MSHPIERPLVRALERRLRESPNLMQVVLGPRQVGKTTALQQVLARWEGPSVYATADLPAAPTVDWIIAQWQLARQKAGRMRCLLVLDEVQKVPRWSEVVKAMFDEDRRTGSHIRTVVLGSSSLLVRHGLAESLAGRFELHHAPHWTFSECKAAFRYSLERWVYFDGYPGAARLARSESRWSEFVRNSLIETVLGRDILQLAPVAKPALLRQLFLLACQAPSEIVAYSRMLGQLQDAGNTVTLAHYLELLHSAYLVSGLSRWSPGKVRLRASSPKLVVWSNALVNALSPLGFSQARARPDLWGRLVENAVGSYLLSESATGAFSVHYWREGTNEIDFVIASGGRVVGLEVKSGRLRGTRGLDAFRARFPAARALVVGVGGISLEDFFSTPPAAWLRSI